MVHPAAEWQEVTMGRPSLDAGVGFVWRAQEATGGMRSLQRDDRDGSSPCALAYPQLIRLSSNVPSQEGSPPPRTPIHPPTNPHAPFKDPALTPSVPPPGPLCTE